jgi:hypothetical protein
LTQSAPYPHSENGLAVTGALELVPFGQLHSSTSEIIGLVVNEAGYQLISDHNKQPFGWEMQMQIYLHIRRPDCLEIRAGIRIGKSRPS